MTDRQDSDREVLTSLPRSRPVRRSAKRGERADAASTASAAPRRAAATTPRTPRSAPASTAEASAAKAKPASAARVKAPAGASSTSKPRATRARAQQPPVPPRRKVPPAGYASPDARAHGASASGTAELLSTTIQAAAELAQIGLTVGRQTLQSMLDRLPKP